MSSTMISSGLNPPMPSATITPENSSYGQRLLTLVRTLEKKKLKTKTDPNDDDDDNKHHDNTTDDGGAYERHMDEIVDLFNSLIVLYSRKGLLQGNLERAEKIVSSTSSSSTNMNINSGGKKQKRSKNNKNKGNNNSELQINTGDNNNNVDGDASSSSSSFDETLVLTAILRTLGQQAELKDSVGSSEDDDMLLLVSLAAELSLSISQGIKMKSGSKCSLAEYQIISQCGKELLKSLQIQLQNIIQHLIYKTMSISNNSQRQQQSSFDNCLVMVSPSLLGDEDDSYVQQSINSCLKASASLIGLFGTKLSRSTAIVSNLKVVAWKCLTLPNDTIQLSASKLVATIPYAGVSGTMNSTGGNQNNNNSNTKKITPSDIWNETVVDAIWLLGMMIETFVPINKISNKNMNGLSDQTKLLFENWTKVIRDDMQDGEEQDRIHAFQTFASGLSSCFNSLMKKDHANLLSGPPMIDAQINIDSIFGIIESYLSFSLSAETVYNKTKKRLRNEAIEGGIISPKAISSQIANTIKKIGHSMLDCFLKSIGGPVLMPYARRIVRICYASLMTSCSGPVRKVIDPTNSVQFDTTKRKRWLHRSIPMRTIAIRTFQIVIISFGSDRSGKSSSNGDTTTPVFKSDGELATSLVAGCLIEEFSKSSDEQDHDWGTFADRVELINQCCQCLKAVLMSCGSFLSDSTRSLIDSAVSSGLNNLEVLSSTASTGNVVFDWSSVKATLLNLGASCIVTSWNDGGASNLRGVLAQTARLFDSDTDITVCLAAKAAIRLCNTVCVPRAPALVFVSRTAPGNNDSIQNTASAQHQPMQSAEEITQHMKVARDESEQLKRLAEETEKAKQQKVDEKRKKEEQMKEEKARKRQKRIDDAKAARSSQAMEGDAMEPKVASLNGGLNSQNGLVADTKKIENVLVWEHPGNPNEKMESEELEKDDRDDGNGEAKMRSDESVSTKPRRKGQDDGDDDNDDDDDGEFPDIIEGGPDSDDE